MYGRELVEPLDLCLRMDAIKGRKQRQIVEELEQRLKIRRKALELLNLRYEEAGEKVSGRGGGGLQAFFIKIHDFIHLRI